MHISTRKFLSAEKSKVLEKCRAESARPADTIWNLWPLDRIFDHFSFLLLGDNHVEEIAKLAMVIVQSTMY